MRELSMHPSAIPVIKNIIRSSDIKEMEALADKVLDVSDADEAEAMVLEVMRERFPEHLQHGGGQPLRGEREGHGP
jgi:phosphoenolpyruvate-protein phosphotransferase (PTS system enzyme I)